MILLAIEFRGQSPTSGHLTILKVTKSTSDVCVTVSSLWRKRRPRSGMDPRRGTLTTVLSRREDLIPARATVSPALTSTFLPASRVAGAGTNVPATVGSRELSGL